MRRVEPRAIAPTALHLVQHGPLQLVDAVLRRDVDLVVLARRVDPGAVGARHLAADQRHRAPVLGHRAADVYFGVCFGGRRKGGFGQSSLDGMVRWIWWNGDGEALGEWEGA